MSTPTPDAAPHGDVEAFVRKLAVGAEFDRVDLAAVHRRLTDLVNGTVEVARPPAPVAAPATVTVPTLRDYAAEAVQALAATPSETARTYASAWRLLTDGIRLADVTSRGRTPWDPERERDWLAHAVAANADLGLHFDVTAHPDDYPREPDTGVLVVWPGHGDLPVTALTTSRFAIACSWARLRTRAEGRRRDSQRQAQGRGPTRWTGDGAVATLITATRKLYALAAADGHVSPTLDPTAAVTKPERGRGRRRPMKPERLHDVAVTFCTTGNDPDLDRLLFAFHYLTGARQEGAWRLQLRHLDDDRQAIAIPDKRSRTKRGSDEDDDWMPVPAWLLDELRAFAAARGSARPDDPVFRYRSRRRAGEPFPPLTRRRYNTIYERIARQHDWAAKTRFGVHTLRHHAAAELQAIGGDPVKQRFLRHEPQGQTQGYGRASFKHLAWAVATWTGHPHPEMERPPWLQNPDVVVDGLGDAGRPVA